MRDTEHFFILLPRLQDQVLAWLETVQDWRAHVVNWAKGFLKEGLIDRAITRDLTWGVPLPPEADTLGESKRIYVWFEAVIGYLSASKEWAKRSGDPDAWKAWWEDPSAETHYFIGKDNIPFHSVFWPAYLIGYGGLNLPTNVPANQYVTFKGEKASKSRGIGTPLLDYLNDYQADAVRYAVGTVLPETNDNDFSEDDMARRINDELVAAWGNLVNRVFAMTHKNFDGVVQEPELDDADRSLLDDVDGLLAEAGELLEKVELRAALRKAMGIAQATNAYLNATEPWRTAKDDPVRTGTSLWVATQAIAAGSIGLAPWLSFSTGPLRVALSLEPDVVGAGWARPEVPAGTTLGELAPLFAKIDTREGVA
jgi:methionyl-tRNA synthetase